MVMKKSHLMYTAIVLGNAAPVLAFAHTGSAAPGQHFVEHLLLALIVGAPVGYALLRLLSGAKPEAGE